MSNKTVTNPHYFYAKFYPLSAITQFYEPIEAHYRDRPSRKIIQIKICCPNTAICYPFLLDENQLPSNLHHLYYSVEQGFICHHDPRIKGSLNVHPSV